MPYETQGISSAGTFSAVMLIPSVKRDSLKQSLRATVGPVPYPATARELPDDRGSLSATEEEKGSRVSRNKRGRTPSCSSKRDAASLKSETQLRPYRGELVELYGASGPFQQHVFYYMMLVFFVRSLHTLLTSAFVPDMDYWCAKPSHVNLTDEEWLRTRVPRQKDGSLNRCFMFLDNGTQVSCDSWYYSKGSWTRTLRDEVSTLLRRSFWVPKGTTYGAMHYMPLEF